MVDLRTLDVFGRSTYPDWRMGFLSYVLFLLSTSNGPNEGPVGTRYTANAYVPHSPG
jgi:hypothetical protein